MKKKTKKTLFFVFFAIPWAFVLPFFILDELKSIHTLTSYHIFYLVLGGTNLFSLFFIYFKYDREDKFYSNLDYLREPPVSISPAEAGVICNDNKVTLSLVYATLLDLVNRKVLNVSTKNLYHNKNDYIFSFNEYSEEELSEHEQFLLEWVKTVYVNPTGTFSINEINSKNNFNLLSIFLFKWAQLIYKKTDRFYYQYNKLKSFSFLYLFAQIILIFIFNNESIFSFIIFFTNFFMIMYIWSIEKRTKEGLEEFVKWSAFKRYLSEFGDFHQKDVNHLVLWDRYMIYAIALNEADYIIQQLDWLPNGDIYIQGSVTSTFKIN